MREIIPKKQVIIICAIAVTFILGMQLVAATAWTADAANEGPGIVILQLSDDPDSDWAVKDLQERLSSFITDDPFFKDRVTLLQTDDPHIAEVLDEKIVIYVSHGGPLGIVTGEYLTSWKTMASIVTDSTAIMHLFTACNSRNIIQFGDDDSGKRLYTVPGARPAEVTNVEIVSTIMLAFGMNPEYVDGYRTNELTKAKELVQSERSVHIMDFEQIILDEIEAIDASYSDTYTDYHRVYRYSEEVVLLGLYGFVDLPNELKSFLFEYYGVWWYESGGNLEPNLRNIMEVDITYTTNYYYEATWIVDPEPPPDDPPDDPPIDDPPIDRPKPSPYDPLLSTFYVAAAAQTGGHWEYGPHIFNGGTYTGLVTFSGNPGYTWIPIDVTASGSEFEEVDAISLKQVATDGIYTSKQKVDGVWTEPVVGRNAGRTGALWTDTASTSCPWGYSLNDWNYRKSHTVEAATGAGTDYQVRIEVRYGTGTDNGEQVFLNGHCQQDFDDIRFVSSDGVTSLDYWMERRNIENYAIFWVEIDESLDYDQDIYIYYGNEAAETISDGDATFLFFDGFDGTSLDTTKWTVDQGVVDISGGQMHLDGTIGTNKAYFYTTEGWGMNIKQEVRAILNTQHPWAPRCASFIDSDYSWDDFIDGQFYGSNNQFRSRVANEFHSSGVSDFVTVTLSDITQWHTYSSYWTPGEVGWAQDNSVFVTHPHFPQSSSSDIPIGEDMSVFFSEAGVVGDDMDVDWIFVRKYVDSEPTHGAWAGEETSSRIETDYEYDSTWPVYPGHYESSGSLFTNGGHMYTTGIPTGSGWHGPSYVQTLPSYFRMGDFGSFSANLSLVHNTDSNRMAWTTVSLYDVNEKIALSLQIYDASNLEQRVQYRARYFKEDGSSEYLKSLQYLGNHNGIVTLRYDPNQGIFGDAPGKDGTLLYLYNGINTDRLIKYVVIQSYRYSSYPEHNDRIYNIRLSYAGSDYTIFHDPCSDMDAFNKDLDFGYGTSSDGEFIVPEGESYMTPTSIPSSPSGWHGPNFVHVLDRPFRLYQLNEFSVVGELIQSSSSLGKTYIALFDENKEIVMACYFGDSSYSLQKGYFTLIFYPQDHGSASYSSGDIYNTGFTKTANFWWGEDQAEHGAIYSSIDGTGDPRPMTEVDNSSRIIKYVVLRSDRYSGNAMPGLRIHDINLVCDLNAHDPTVVNPYDVMYDGTDDGTGPTSDVNPDSQQFAESSFVANWIESFWPTVRILVNAVFGACSLVVDLTVDILGDVNIFNSDFNINGINFDDPVTAQRISAQIEQGQVSTAKTGFALKAATAAVMITSWLTINWATYAIFVTNLVLWNIFMYAHLWALYHEYANGRKTVDDALAGVGSVMLGWLMTLLSFKVKTSIVTDSVKATLVKVFGQINAGAMRAARWTMIIAGIMWLLVMVYEIGLILTTQSLGSTFQTPSWIS